jgi:hypothetical protein
MLLYINRICKEEIAVCAPHFIEQILIRPKVLAKTVKICYNNIRFQLFTVISPCREGQDDQEAISE